MALRWTAAGMMEATKGFRRLKAHKQLPIKAAAAALQAQQTTKQKLEENLRRIASSTGNARPEVQHRAGHPADSATVGLEFAAPLNSPLTLKPAAVQFQCLP